MTSAGASSAGGVAKCVWLHVEAYGGGHTITKGGNQGVLTKGGYWDGTQGCALMRMVAGTR